MKLKEFLQCINEQVERDPSLLELNCYYVSDDEGNSGDFQEYTPEAGYIDDDANPIHPNDIEPHHRKVFYIN